jgi:hypothetical protein
MTGPHYLRTRRTSRTVMPDHLALLDELWFASGAGNCRDPRPNGFIAIGAGILVPALAAAWNASMRGYRRRL